MIDLEARAPATPSDLTGLTADSRAVRPGFLFAALPGTRVDGRAFIADAVANGARWILAPEGTALPDEAADAGARLIADANPRRRFALMAADFYARQPDTIAAVTGTAGKTSVAAYTRQIWRALGHEAASVGTLGVVTPGGASYGGLTTPDPVALHASLADLAAAGVTHLAMEASSHGLHQYRLDGVRVGAAGFTNLSRDHLDYHPTMADYLAAKIRLFTEVLRPDGTGVVNVDSAEGRKVAEAARAAGRAVATYGETGEHLRLAGLEPHADSLVLDIAIDGAAHRATLPLVGTFQALNVLCALGLVLADPAVDRAAAVAALGSLEGVRGRLEKVAETAEGAPVFVDYAHKPGALEAVLTALRPHAVGRLVVVFGCGGDRDKGKRPEMGEVAARLADRVIVTDDNPRTEDPATIRAAVMAGCPGAREIGDRAEAIAAAIDGMAAGDVLVIAGKGHETGQIVGDTVRPFDDAAQAREAVAAVRARTDR
ncbi:MAG: UDP-N-acetylmuramoyl-L-alanyl-D-glutamate--2,6-diaminopimelate ligase [Azospirillaceae bacterium]